MAWFLAWYDFVEQQNDSEESNDQTFTTKFNAKRIHNASSWNYFMAGGMLDRTKINAKSPNKLKF